MAVKDARRLFLSRWGIRVPVLDDPDTRSQLVAFADLVAASQRRPRPGRDLSPAAIERRVVDVLLLVSPELSEEAHDIASMALDVRRRWSPEDLGEVFELTPEERSDLGITVIRPAGFGGPLWEDFKRERERLRGERRRREAGARPRSEIDAEAAILRAEMAEFLAATGKSERTFWRWKRKGRDWREGVTVARPDQCSSIAPDALLPSAPSPAGERAKRDPALALAEIVVASTGIRPAAVLVERDMALVVLEPSQAGLGELLAGHIAWTLADIGSPVVAEFDGKASVRLSARVA